jgi:CRISPR-associated protein Csx14
MPTRKYNEVFVFVSGSTPQIITETIFALSQQTPPVHPDELFIITTSTGKKRISESLIGDGILGQMAAEYELPLIPLTKDSFRVARDPEGVELEDIRTEEENESAAEIITDLIREKTSLPGNRLHCSLAGGRKTMSYYLGSTLGLFGRKWDNLYHVLVTPEFETNPHFYYKPAINREIPGRLPDGSKTTLNTDDAVISLASLRFIRLRDKLSLHGRGFSELVTEGQREIDMAARQPELTLDLRKRSLSVGGFELKLSPVHMMLYAFFIRRKTGACLEESRESCAGCTGCYFVPFEFTEGDIEAMKKDYAAICGRRHRWEVVGKTWKEGVVDTALVRSIITKINSAITKTLQPHGLADQVVITCDKRYASSGYGIRLCKGKIRIV